MLTWWPLHHTVENFCYAAPGGLQNPCEESFQDPREDMLEGAVKQKENSFYAAPDGLQDPFEVHARGSREAEDKL